MKKTILTLLLICVLMPLHAMQDGPHFYIVLSQNEDAYDSALFMQAYLSTFGIESEIRKNTSDIRRDELTETGHPLSLRFWYMDDKLMLRSEDLRTGQLYFISGAYGIGGTAADHRAWLTEELNSLAYDLYLDDLIEKDARMKREEEPEMKKFPVIFVERGYGEGSAWTEAIADALVSEGLMARVTDDSMGEAYGEDEYPFSVRLWIFPDFMEFSVFDISEDSDGTAYYVDLEDTGSDEETEKYIIKTAKQIKRLMENDRHLRIMRPEGKTS